MTAPYGFSHTECPVASCLLNYPEMLNRHLPCSLPPYFICFTSSDNPHPFSCSTVLYVLVFISTHFVFPGSQQLAECFHIIVQSVLYTVKLNWSHKLYCYCSKVRMLERINNLSKMQFSSMPLLRLSYSKRRLLMSMGSPSFSSHGGKGISIKLLSGASPRYPRDDTSPVTAGLQAACQVTVTN